MPELLSRSDDVRVWMLAGALAGATIIGYCLSRSVGLPTEHGAEKGEWLELLGVASLFVEAIVVWLAVTRLRQRTMELAA